MPAPSPILPSTSLPTLYSEISAVIETFTAISYSLVPLVLAATPVPRLSYSGFKRCEILLFSLAIYSVGSRPFLLVAGVVRQAFCVRVCMGKDLLSWACQFGITVGILPIGGRSCVYGYGVPGLFSTMGPLYSTYTVSYGNRYTNQLVF